MISISLFFTFCERFLKLRYNNVDLVTSELSILNEDRTLGRTNGPTYCTNHVYGVGF